MLGKEASRQELSLLWGTQSPSHLSITGRHPGLGCGHILRQPRAHAPCTALHITAPVLTPTWGSERRGDWPKATQLGSALVGQADPHPGCPEAPLSTGPRGQGPKGTPSAQRQSPVQWARRAQGRQVSCRRQKQPALARGASGMTLLSQHLWRGPQAPSGSPQTSRPKRGALAQGSPAHQVSQPPPHPSLCPWDPPFIPHAHRTPALTATGPPEV